MKRRYPSHLPNKEENYIMSETTAEYSVNKDKNTVIITSDGEGINSKEYWGYALQPYYDPGDHDDVGYGTRAESSGLRLVACKKDRANDVLICIIEDDDYARATRILNNLLMAVKNGERIWDIQDDVDYVIPF